MKNPLNHRLLRELRGDIWKYLAIFLLLTATIGLVSGFMVADGSMIRAYNDSFTVYNIEDGHFRTQDAVNRAQHKAIESLGISIYNLNYVEDVLDNGSTMRIFANREQVDQVCVMYGKQPEQLGEIAIDRMYADNNGIKVGDTLTGSGRSWTVTGLVALSDYSALFSDNSDTMFDALKFGVAVVTQEQFDAYDKDKLLYCYAWKYDNPPVDKAEENDRAQDLLDDLNDEVALEEFLPRYQNKAIVFTGDDMGNDRAMMLMLLYIVIVIIAIVFAMTINNTIVKESNVIGTLRASGYTKNELVQHYMTMPLLVTLVSALVGNLMGYTFFKNRMAGMYYGSYSLPTYVTIWNGEAFLLTTVVPFLIMLAINFFVLRYRLSLSPLKFLRRDLRRRRQHRALPLSHRLPFFTRFRLRVIFQNLGNYGILLLGIVFAYLLLLFGLALPASLSHYQEEIENNLLCNYQYILQVPVSAMNDDRKLESLVHMMKFRRAVETENEDAEKFSAYSLKTTEEKYPSEDIMLYGVAENSRYIALDSSLLEGESNVPSVYISQSMQSKYGYQVGDTLTLKEEYEDTAYSFRVAAFFDYGGSLSIFMKQDTLNETFDLGESYYSGYLSETEITDIDEKYVGSAVDVDALTKISRQLDVSMGSMMYMVDVFAIVMFVLIIYLLSKAIIEKNTQSISMTKILGYTSREISQLYIVTTTIMVVVFLLITLPLETFLMNLIFKEYILNKMSGWITFYHGLDIYIKMFDLGIVTYAVVAIFEYRKIHKVPMDEALKNVE